MDAPTVVAIAKELKYAHDHNALSKLVLEDFFERLKVAMPEMLGESAEEPMEE